MSVLSAVLCKNMHVYHQKESAGFWLKWDMSIAAQRGEKVLSIKSPYLLSQTNC